MDLATPTDAEIDRIAAQALRPSLGAAARKLDELQLRHAAMIERYSTLQETIEPVPDRPLYSEETMAVIKKIEASPEWRELWTAAHDAVRPCEAWAALVSKKGDA